MGRCRPEAAHSDARGGGVRTRMSPDFQEIAHGGGKVMFTIKVDEHGEPMYEVGFTSNRPMSMVGVYALQQGVPVGKIELGGIGQPWNAPPLPGCVPVLIVSDSEGYFGHNCPGCGAYWRSEPWPRFCPYCRECLEPHQALSQAQLRYVQHYCHVLMGALDSTDDGQVEIDMDAVADATGSEEDRPSFYVSEESQQRKFVCTACGAFNDILGTFGYCAACGTRNDLDEFRVAIVPAIRERLKTGTPPEDCVRTAIASFDSLVGRLSEQLVSLIPMSPNRHRRLSGQRFHNLVDVAKVLHEWFDIDIRADISETDWGRAVILFHRRHVYEHKGGEVDQKYLDDSGDTTVRLKQRIHESTPGVHDLLGTLLKMASNLHEGFHSIFPPSAEPIAAFEEQQARKRDHGAR